MQRFIQDTNRQSDAMVAFYDMIGREHHGFKRAADGYRERRERYGAEDADAWIATLGPEQRAYAILQSTGSTGDRRRHPMNRLVSIVNVAFDIERDMMLRRLGDTSSRRDPTPISLTAEQRTTVRQVLALIRHIEANNALVTLRHDQFANLNLLDIRQAHDLLRAASPEVFAEYERRLSRAHVSDFADAQRWPSERDRLLREWQDAVDRGAALDTRRRSRRPTRLPIGGSPDVTAPLQ